MGGQHPPPRRPGDRGPILVGPGEERLSWGHVSRYSAWEFAAELPSPGEIGTEVLEDERPAPLGRGGAQKASQHPTSLSGSPPTVLPVAPPVTRISSSPVERTPALGLLPGNRPPVCTSVNLRFFIQQRGDDDISMAGRCQD